MEEGKRRPKIRPHEEEDDWDWRQAQKNIDLEEQDDFDFAESYTNIRDQDDEISDELEGEDNGKDKGKQEQAKDSEEGKN